MDDLEDKELGFDWRRTPDSKHPDGLDCRCPRHEYFREQKRYLTDANASGHFTVPSIKLCPGHYDVFVGEMIDRLPTIKRWTWRLLIRVRLLKIIRLPEMNSEDCFLCRFGSGGGKKIPEIPAQ